MSHWQQQQQEEYQQWLEDPVAQFEYQQWLDKKESNEDIGNDREQILETRRRWRWFSGDYQRFQKDQRCA